MERKFGIFDGTMLKGIMLIFMVCDHIHQMFYNQGAPIWLSMVGRLVLPTFLFLVTEAWSHTRSQRRYMLRLLYGSLAMGILSGIVSSIWQNPDVVLMNNIFSSFLVTCWYLWCIDRIRQRKIVSGLLLMLVPVVTSIPMLVVGVLSGSDTANLGLLRILASIAIAIPNLLTVEGGSLVVLLGVLMYLLRSWRIAQAAVVLLFGLWNYLAAPGEFQWMMGLAAIPILLYNGKRGKGMKTFFYVFYPAHIYFLYILAYYI
jgi:hypothetical protein